MDTRPALSPRQREALEIIRAYVAEHGYPPSLREIAARMGIRSPNGVLDHVRALAKKGYIERGEGKQSRGLRVVGATEDAEHRARLWESRARAAGWTETGAS